MKMEQAQESEHVVGLASEPPGVSDPSYRTESLDPDSRRLLRRVPRVNSADHDVFVGYTDEELGFSRDPQPF